MSIYFAAQSILRRFAFSSLLLYGCTFFSMQLCATDWVDPVNLSHVVPHRNFSVLTWGGMGGATVGVAVAALLFLNALGDSKKRGRKTSLKDFFQYYYPLIPTALLVAAEALLGAGGAKVAALAYTPSRASSYGIGALTGALSLWGFNNFLRQFRC